MARGSSQAKRGGRTSRPSQRSSHRAGDPSAPLEIREESLAASGDPASGSLTRGGAPPPVLTLAEPAHVTGSSGDTHGRTAARRAMVSPHPSAREVLDTSPVLTLNPCAPQGGPQASAQGAGASVGLGRAPQPLTAGQGPAAHQGIREGELHLRIPEDAIPGERESGHAAAIAAISGPVSGLAPAVSSQGLESRATLSDRRARGSSLPGQVRELAPASVTVKFRRISQAEKFSNSISRQGIEATRPRESSKKGPGSGIRATIGEEGVRDILPTRKTYADVVRSPPTSPQRGVSRPLTTTLPSLPPAPRLKKGSRRTSKETSSERRRQSESRTDTRVADLSSGLPGGNVEICSSVPSPGSGHIAQIPVYATTNLSGIKLSVGANDMSPCGQIAAPVVPHEDAREVFRAPSPQLVEHVEVPREEEFHRAPSPIPEFVEMEDYPDEQADEADQGSEGYGEEKEAFSPTPEVDVRMEETFPEEEEEEVFGIPPTTLHTHSLCHGQEDEVAKSYATLAANRERMPESSAHAEERFGNSNNAELVRMLITALNNSSQPRARPAKMKEPIKFMGEPREDVNL